MSRKNIKRDEEQARFKMIEGWFDRHAIVTETRTHALFKHVCETPDSFGRGRWSNTYWFETTLLSGGMLLVHGDICHVVFAHHNAQTLHGAVNWLGEDELGSSYVYEKAVIGMRVHTLPHDRVRVAHAALRTARRLLFAGRCLEQEGVHVCCLAQGHKGPHTAREDPTLNRP